LPLGFERSLQHLAVGPRKWNNPRDSGRLTTQRGDLIGQELRMELLVGHLGKAKLNQLRPTRPHGLRRIGQILDNCAELTSVVFVQVLDEYFFIHLCLQAVDVGGCCGANDPGHPCGSSMPAGKLV
jgi:hypothetical protein